MSESGQGLDWWHGAGHAHDIDMVVNHHAPPATAHRQPQLGRCMYLITNYLEDLLLFFLRGVKE